MKGYRENLEAFDSEWPGMDRAGRAYVEANYDINKLNDRLVEIYQQLLQNRLKKENLE